MRWLWRTLLLTLFLMLLLLSVLATVDNAEPVQLQLLGAETPALSLYWWLVLAWVAGMLIGWLFALRAQWRLRGQLRELRRLVQERGL